MLISRLKIVALVLVGAVSLSDTCFAFRIEPIPGVEIKGDDPKIPPPRIDPPKIDLPKIDVPKIDLPKIDLPKLPDPTKKEFWEKPGNYLLPQVLLIPEVNKAVTQAVEQVGTAVLTTAKTVANDTVRTLINAQRDVITTIEKAGSDTVKSIEKVGKDATATYLKAWKDTAEQARQSLNDAAEAAAAVKRYQERELEAKIRAANNAIRRVNEGKFLDAAWHIGTEQLQATEENYFKATQESTLISAAGQAAATAYGGPGGASAYTAWHTYRTTGDPEMAIRAGVLSAITSQGGSAVSGLPSGTATEVIKKAALAGAVGGLAVAAAGGDEKAITDAFLRSGGAVLVQSSTESFKMHNPKAADALQTVHCLSTRDVDCLSNTTYGMDAKGKILYENGKPRIEKYIPQSIAKWTQPDPNSPEAKQVAFITKLAKLAKSGEIPVFDGKWVITTNLGINAELAQNAPMAVLTYAGDKPPFDFRTDYEYSEQVAAYVCKLGSERRISVTQKGTACQTLHFRDGNTETIFRSPNHPMKCLAEASKFVKGRMKELGASCNPA